MKHIETIMEARRLLESLTPLRSDCGALCGAACCKSDEDGQGGVYLVPGEEALYQSVDWARLNPCMLEGSDTHLFLCEGRCERSLRPFGCMIFPLTPVRREQGWSVRMDWRAWAVCPLMRCGKKGLDPEFVLAAKRSVQKIASAPGGEEFLQSWQKMEERFRSSEL